MIGRMTAIVFLGLAIPLVSLAEEPKPLPLPAPQLDSSKSLVRALKERRSMRAFGPEKLSPRHLSNLLWAAFGVNRPDSHGRTAPSTMDCQEIDVYVASADGLFLYDAAAHGLRQVLAQDIRAETGRQPFVKDAAVNLVFVADLAKADKIQAAERDFYCATDAGFISQNVYLYCASEGLATVVRGFVDRPALAKTMKLRPDQKILLAQSVGYPKK